MYSEFSFLDPAQSTSLISCRVPRDRESVPTVARVPDQLPVGLLGQLVDCCNGIAKARVRIPYKSEFF